MNSPTKAEELYQLLKRHAVTREFRPLAIGVKEEIQAAFPEFTLEDVAVVLRRHCKHGKCLTALVRGEQRFHLKSETFI
jgi:RNA chaperone ProQ/FINO-like protein